MHGVKSCTFFTYQPELNHWCNFINSNLSSVPIHLAPTIDFFTITLDFFFKFSVDKPSIEEEQPIPANIQDQEGPFFFEIELP